MDAPMVELLTACEERGLVLFVRHRWLEPRSVLVVSDPRALPPRVLARARGRTLDDAAEACLARLITDGRASHRAPDPRRRS